jgi:hypothetical protein
MSGPHRYRVAAQRVVSPGADPGPDLLLLDEPFGALALTREKGRSCCASGRRGARRWSWSHSISRRCSWLTGCLCSATAAEIVLDLNIHLPRPRGEEIRYPPIPKTVQGIARRFGISVV